MKVSANDSVAHVIYKSFDFLKKINYLPFIGERTRATIVIPVGKLIYNSDVDTALHPDVKTIADIKLTLANVLEENLNKLFNYDIKARTETERFIYLKPFIVQADKVVYD